jgi:hypothetical protein
MDGLILMNGGKHSDVPISHSKLLLAMEDIGGIANKKFNASFRPSSVLREVVLVTSVK